MKILFLISFMILILITNTPSFAVERFSEDELTSIFTHDVQMGELAIMWLGNHQKGSLPYSFTKSFSISAISSSPPMIFCILAFVGRNLAQKHSCE